jgi:hypothetical protein
MKIWVGPEMEGHLEGWKTLFIASPTITLERINEILFEQTDIKQIYFGAGVCTPINTKVLRQFIQQNSDILVTAEIDINNLNEYSFGVLKNVNLIITINHPNLGLLNYVDKNNTQIKLQTLNLRKNILTIGKLKNFVQTDLTNLKGIKYKKDIIIE